MKRTGKVLVLGDDARSFLAVVRSLGRKGIDVHTAWASPACPTLRSRYVSTNHAIPAFLPGSDVWIAAFESLLHRERFDLVIPCDDPRILPLQKERERLLRAARIELLEPEIQRITSSKQESHALASRLGVPVARSILVKSESELDAAIPALSAPYVIKPLFSFTLERLQTRYEVKKAFSLDEAHRLGRWLLKTSALQIQENFVGVGVGVEFLAARGEILTIFQHLRIHEPLHGGGSSYRSAVEVHGQMRAAAEAIVRQLQYDGVGMVEFKWNPTSDRFIFIEVNGRFWGSLPLALSCGADFPAFLYDYRVHGRREFPRRFRTNLYARNWSDDIDWFRANASASRTDPTLATLPWSKVAPEIWHIVSGRERIDTLTLDDPYPFVLEVVGWTGAKSKGLGKKALRSFRQLRWIRARQSSRLKERVRTARHVEFVCYGNIMRSPYVSTVVSAHPGATRSRATFGSSGFHHVTGRSCPVEAVVAARERGVDLSSHRSRRIDRETVVKSDVILVFDWDNLQQLEAEFPEAKGKAFLLGIFDQEKHVAITDPFGQPAHVVRETYSRIDSIVRSMFG
jgi:protein-tyrosine-phosphatase/predicted ATP-grasp superfamily ATP-dependent carboligase